MELNFCLYNGKIDIEVRIKKMNEEISILHFKKKDLEYSKLFALLVEKKHQKHNSF